MPIRINLMAEAQALEEARRRNPVKLGIWIAGFLVALVGLWIAKNQGDIYFAKLEYTKLNSDWKSFEAKYSGVTNAEARLAGIKGKLAALDHLQTNRFLWGSVLNALQETVVDQVQVTRIWGTQTIEREPNKSLAGKTIPGSANLEKIKLSIVGKDFSSSGEGYKKYEDALNHLDFFSKMMGGHDGFTIEGTPGPKFQEAPGSPREFRVFTLTNQFPDIRREGPMTKLTKTQRDQLIGVAVGAVVAMACLWYFVVVAQGKELAATVKKSKEMRGKLTAAAAEVRKADEITTELTNNLEVLKLREATFAPDREPYSWMVEVMGRFYLPPSDLHRYKTVSNIDFKQPEVTEKGVIAGFPYKWARFHITCQGYYYDFGKFIADFENHFHYFRVENLDITVPGVRQLPDMLSYSFDVVAPQAPAAESK